MKIFVLAIFISFLTSCSDSPRAGNWAEPPKRKHSDIKIEWISRSEFFLIDEAEQEKAVGMLRNNSLLLMSESEFRSEFPSSSENETGYGYITLIRAASNKLGADNSVGFYGGEIFSVARPLGVCENLGNAVIAIKGDRGADGVRVICARTM